MLTCDICNGNLVMDGSREFAVCEGCGMKYSKEALRSMLSGATQAAPAPATGEADRLAENGEQFMKLKEYDKAQKVYAQLMTSHPEDWRGWWGLFVIQITTASFSKFEDFVQNEKYAQNAFAVAGTMQGAIRQQYDVLWDGFLAQMQGSLAESMFRALFSQCFSDKWFVCETFIKLVDDGMPEVCKRLAAFVKNARDLAISTILALGAQVNKPISLCSIDMKPVKSEFVLQHVPRFIHEDFYHSLDEIGNGSSPEFTLLLIIGDIWIIHKNYKFYGSYYSDIKVLSLIQPLTAEIIEQIYEQQKALHLKRWNQGLCPYCGSEYSAFNSCKGRFCGRKRKDAEQLFINKLRQTQ